MTKLRVTFGIAKYCFAASLAALGFAQELPPPKATGSARPPDETIVLSPFEVTADTGYKYGTTKSNSVTMFNQDTTKLPVSVDVMTSQFMRDMAITDMDMLVAYNATGGGWGSTQSGDDALPKQPGDRVANTELKLRGIGAGGLRRDGLISSNNSSFNDSFATEGIEILKGPNALL
jgi:outer membrane receptor for ferric coprogen and ferric-rhodotorulic acid